MRALFGLALLILSGCGLSYEVSWPFELSFPTYVVRGEPIPRTLYWDGCEFYFGQRLTDTAQSCVAALARLEDDTWAVDSLEFFGLARASLYANSRDELRAFLVVPDTPDQFDGIVDYYADLFEIGPLRQSAPVYACPENGEVVDRVADWKDTVTQLVVVEDGCTGLVSLRFTDLLAGP